jgi:serine/threonine protein kinase
MRDSQGVVRLMDFGIAKGSEETGSSGLTVTGAVMGTPEYMSPEQCRGEKIDARSDLYSLGVVVWELFTGQVPYRGDTPVATIFKHIQDPIPFGTEAARKLPTPLRPVLEKLLAKDREQRFTTAAEVGVALRQAREASAGLPPAFAPPLTEVPPPTEDPPPTEAPEASPPSERRTTGRLEIHVNLMTRRVSPLGTVLQEEHTIAENISRGGARVLTTMSSLVVGDLIQIEEIGGSFKTRAEVRGTYLGKDNVRRLNLRFADAEAPARLWRTDSGAMAKVGGGTPVPAGERRRR